ncbi:MAG: HD domain-containing protein [Candidatus Peribacteraceae bacterium]
MREPSADILLAACKHLTEGEQSDIEEAYAFALEKHASQTREDGSPYVLHVIDTATIVANWGADRDTIIAALLHDVLEDTAVTKSDLLERFGKRVALLVEATTKFTAADLNPALDLERKTETLRKLFDVMRMDTRCIVIKLADRLHNVLTIDALPDERRERFARETMNVYYKIAFHLGMREVRRQFAEHCVPYVYPEGATDIRERDRLCQQFQSLPHTIERVLKAQESESSGIDRIFLQPRNAQIFHDKRTARGGTAASQDAFSLIAIVTDEEHCYHFLKSIHTLYRPVVGQFRDYIAAPSDSGYQSLHTHVSLPDGQIVEIRIYTESMFKRAMMGIIGSLFGHGAASPGFAWLKRTEELDVRTRESSSAFWEALESDILRETISISIDQRRLSLPMGSTALDAAFALYEQRASCTTRIAVNGIQSSFSHVLKEDDNVHVTLDSVHHVTFEWLDAVSTRHARFLISEELKHHSRAEKIALGSRILQRELDHYGKGLIQHLTRSQCQAAATKYSRRSFDQVLSMIGEGVLRSRDVVFFLFPEERRTPLFMGRLDDFYRFRIVISFTDRPSDPLADLSKLAKIHSIHIDALTQEHGKSEVVLHVVGHSDTRQQFADFVEALERHEHCLGVQTLIPALKKSILVGSFLLAGIVLLVDVILLPWYQDVFEGIPYIPRLLLQAVPLVPVLVANLYLLRLLRQYIVRMRTDRWYLVVGLVLNVGSLGVLVGQMMLNTKGHTLLPLIGFFTLFLVYMGYRFLRTEALFAPFDEKRMTPLSDVEWQSRRRRKMMGYCIRLCGVFIWGIQPIVIRYTPANDLSPFLRTFLYGLGAMSLMVIAYLLPTLLRRGRLPSLKLPYNHAFLMIVFGQVGFYYFLNASLLYTSATNLLLFNTFAPVIALIIAAFFWRKDIPYLRDPKVMLGIFLLAVMATIGSTLLIQNSSASDRPFSLFGDMLAMVAMFFDVLFVIGQIEYVKHFAKSNVLLLNLHVYSFVLLCLAPVIVLGTVLGTSILAGLTQTSLLFGLGIGVMIGVGQLLNYEAFKRIDGYLAFMMFNISVLITFVIETFLLRSVQPTPLLIVSGLFIIGASVIAEIMNSRCEKKGA